MQNSMMKLCYENNNKIMKKKNKLYSLNALND